MHTHRLLADFALQESQLERIRKLDETERLEQIPERPEHLDVEMSRLVDAGADDRQIWVLLSKPPCRFEELAIGRLDEDDVRLSDGMAVEGDRLVTQTSDHSRIEPPDVGVGFADQETSHEHVVADRGMFPRATSV